MTQKWVKIDSGGSTPKWPKKKGEEWRKKGQKWLKSDRKPFFFCHFLTLFGSLGRRPPRVTFQSLLGHFHYFGVLGSLGGTTDLRAGFRQNGFFRGFLFLSRRIFSRTFSPDFSSSFLWEKVPRKILQENPRQNPPKFIQQKSSNTFLQIAQGNRS